MAVKQFCFHNSGWGLLSWGWFYLCSAYAGFSFIFCFSMYSLIWHDSRAGFRIFGVINSPYIHVIWCTTRYLLVLLWEWVVGDFIYCPCGSVFFLTLCGEIWIRKLQMTYRNPKAYKYILGLVQSTGFTEFFFIFSG